MCAHSQNSLCCRVTPCSNRIATITRRYERFTQRSIHRSRCNGSFSFVFKRVFKDIVLSSFKFTASQLKFTYKLVLTGWDFLDDAAGDSLAAALLDVDLREDGAASSED